MALYAIHISSLPLELFWRGLALLPPDEQQRIMAYHRWEDRYQAFSGALCMRFVLAEHLGSDGSYIHILRDRYGKPYLEKDKWKGDFNLSHSGEWLLVGVIEHGKIGVDIEKMEPIDVSIASSFLSPNEQRYFQGEHFSKQLHLFYGFWTLKEAYMKAVGLGHTLCARQIEFKLGDKIELNDQTESKRWAFQQLAIAEGYQAAYCVSCSHDVPELQMDTLVRIVEAYCDQVII